MANVLKHAFTSAKADGADATLVQASHWNDGHKFTGGAHGGLLMRDTSDSAYGATWVAPGTVVGQLLTWDGSAWVAAVLLPTWLSVSLGGSRAASLPLAAATYDLVNAEPAFTVPTLSAAVLATARIVADCKTADASVSITPRLINAISSVVAGTGVACTATADDYTGTNQHQTIAVTLVAGQTYKAQAIVSAGVHATFCTIRLEVG
jgi:hypothetical protein